MKRSVIISSIGGSLLVVGMLVLSPQGNGAFFSIPGLIIVIGGTLLATLLSRPVDDVRNLWRSLPQLFRPEATTADRDIAQLLRFAELHRYSTPRTAEQALADISNPLLSLGLRQVIEGCKLEDVSKAMQWRIAGVRAHDNSQTQILYTMAAFAPAFGMLGTLFGLVHMLSGIGDAGLNQIGGSMAFAMVTTVYGIIASNLVFKPLAMKMERRGAQRLLQMTALMEGVLQIHQRRHPTLIKEALESYSVQYSPVPAAAQSPLTLVKA